MLLTLEMIRSEWMRTLLAAHLHRLWRRECGRRWERNNPEKLKAKQFRANHSPKGKAKQFRYNRTAKSKSRDRRYAKRHPDRIKAAQKDYNHSPEGKARFRRYEKTPKGPLRQKRYNRTPKAKLKSKRYIDRHPEKVKFMASRYRKSERGKLQAKEWRKRNPEKVRAQWSRTQKRRYSTNIQFRLMKHYRSRTAAAFKAQGARMSASTSKLMGCTWAELKAHIESQFQPWMTWENYGISTWHVDHIKPISRFDLTDPAQAVQCFNYKNLRPLAALDNIRKSDKYQEPIPA